MISLTQCSRVENGGFQAMGQLHISTCTAPPGERREQRDAHTGVTARGVVKGNRAAQGALAARRADDGDRGQLARVEPELRRGSPAVIQNQANRVEVTQGVERYKLFENMKQSWEPGAFTSRVETRRLTLQGLTRLQFQLSKAQGLKPGAFRLW